MKYRYYICALLFFFQTLIANDDAQFWQIGLQPITTYQSILFSFRQEYRLDMPRWKCLDVRLSLFCKKTLTKNVDTEFHYTHISFRRINDIWYQKRHRFEFEINPRVFLDKDTQLYFRNRLELVKFENRATWTHIFRQRTQITRNLHSLYFRNISMHHETFYNFNLERIFEYRFCPFDLVLKLTDPYSYRIFGLFRFIKTSRQGTNPFWTHQFVIGSSIEW